MSAMLERAKRMGASSRDLQAMKATYDGGRMQITDSQFILSVDGETGTMALPYKILSSGNGCYKLNVRMEGKENSAQYCLRDGFLEVEDLSTRRAIEIYRRSS
jgi:hypothetical protein